MRILTFVKPFRRRYTYVTKERKRRRKRRRKEEVEEKKIEPTQRFRSEDGGKFGFHNMQEMYRQHFNSKEISTFLPDIHFIYKRKRKWEKKPERLIPCGRMSNNQIKNFKNKYKKSIVENKSNYVCVCVLIQDGCCTSRCFHWT